MYFRHNAAAPFNRLQCSINIIFKYIIGNKNFAWLDLCTFALLWWSKTEPVTPHVLFDSIMKIMITINKFFNLESQPCYTCSSFDSWILSELSFVF